MNTPKHRLRTAGLSLIELLVAIAIGGILMGGAISLFINNRATYEITNDMARLQENARFALQLLSEDIRMAGYVGCSNDLTKLNDNVVDAVGNPLVDGRLATFQHGIEGFEGGNDAVAAANSWSPSLFVGEDDAIIAGRATAPAYGAFFAGSDGITLRYLAGNLVQTAGLTDNEVVNASPNDANASNTVIQVRALSANTLQSGQVAAIADCGGADLFELTADPGTVGVNDSVTANALQRSYEALNRAIVAPFVGVRYFVRLNNANVPALFRSTLAPNDPETEITVELVDGVQSLQILYGVDSDQDGVANEFLSAGTTSTVDPGITLNSRNDYLSVVAVKVSLLLSTVDEFGTADDNTVYDVGNERFCRTGIAPAPAPACTRTYAPDNRRRRVFQTTIAVRNFQ